MGFSPRDNRFCDVVTKIIATITMIRSCVTFYSASAARTQTNTG